MNQVRPAVERVELKKKMSFDNDTLLSKKSGIKKNYNNNIKGENCTSIDKESCIKGRSNIF
jgi:hypothetical protein